MCSVVVCFVSIIFLSSLLLSSPETCDGSTVLPARCDAGFFFSINGRLILRQVVHKKEYDPRTLDIASCF